MWRVSAPTVSAKDVAEACARGIRDKDLKKRVGAASETLSKNSVALQSAMANQKMHLIQPAHFPTPGLSGLEMKWLYDQQLSKLGRPARRIYDQIVSTAPGLLCCYCQYGLADTLDHFAPKSQLSSFSIDPWNLVPACEKCNHKLRTQWGETLEEQFFHPFEMPQLGRWLRGRVKDRGPIRIEFYVEPETGHDVSTQARIEYEFISLGLADLFAVVSAGDITATSRSLTRNYPTGSEVLVRQHLLETAGDSFAGDENHRRGVVLEALANDDSFCRGGYTDIG